MNYGIAAFRATRTRHGNSSFRAAVFRRRPAQVDDGIAFG
jgi:hypothetical protein